MTELAIDVSLDMGKQPVGDDGARSLATETAFDGGENKKLVFRANPPSPSTVRAMPSC